MKRGVAIFWGGIVVVILVSIGAIAFLPGSRSGELDAFAQCLKDKGAIFYGAFWCPHCVATKKMFGSSARLLPYVECSTPDRKGQFQICKDKNVSGYPTWDFADGKRLTGELTLQQLADASACTLP